MSSEGPPDQWDEQVIVPPRSVSGKKLSKNRPILSDEAEESRRMWVFAMRTHHESRSGEPSNYDSNPMWDGGVCGKTGRRYENSIWPGFVAKAGIAGYSPRELIETLFKGWASDTAPTPHMATGESNLQKAARNRLIRRRQVSDSLRTEEAIYKAELWGAMQATPSRDDASRFVLNDTSRIMSPLFRYSVAVLAKLPDVAERWRNAAVAQFQSDAPAYLEYWSALIPEPLKKSAQPAA